MQIQIDTEKCKKDKICIIECPFNILREKTVTGFLKSSRKPKNLQPVHWVLVDDRDKIHELAKMTVQWLEQNNAYPGISAAWEAGEDMILRSAPLIAIAHTATDALIPIADCSIAVTSLELAATSYGIGSFWAGFFMMAASHYPPITQYLNLPENHAVYAALALGYPKFKYHHIPERREAKVSWL